MPKTKFTKAELEELLANEPDTKLKRKMLAMLEPHQDELTQFREFMQTAMDNLTTTFGKRRIVIPEGKRGINAYEHGSSFKVGKCRIGLNISLDYIEQARIEIYDSHGNGYSAAEIRIRRDNPQAAADLAKLTVDYLNGDQ